MKYFNRLHLSFIPLFFLTTCHSWNFYADPDDKGLSRFTSRGYNIATSYINGSPFRNIGLYYPLLQKDSTGNSIDTLKFTWPLYPNDLPNRSAAYDNISFLLPVPATFTKNDFLTFNGHRFANSIPVILRESSSKSISGIASLYFVSISENLASPDYRYLKLSGLFDGKIGDSVLITKGRFDFEVGENGLNF
ncbi:hypothetical protein FW778_04050 [Ginsengibacter hankyongi]|uniref:Uncharacterized protein n=1 Tax=Ginsengibacter hankyongi TaxID=2607284 RepID=A0A5J5IJQ4_9BACT|nr:hypothetical protein [Ginsengibacter hankyongi]KAA9041216.1 hypothetical protein FW778_04050 [Ginsengibacter hankyongi]